MARLKVIGITGGVGSGKSSVLTYLKEKYNAVVLIADILAKNLMEPGGETYNQILNEFGEDLKDDKGIINKELLARRIFQMGYGTEKINEMVHPAVVRKISERIEKEKLECIVDPTDSLHLCIVEAALLFEGHADSLCDEVWYIHVDSKIRIERLMKSRGYTKDKCLAIINSQLSDDEFMNRCHITLDNSGDFEIIKSQIDKEIQRLESIKG